MKHIIAVVEGARFDIAPKYEGKFAKVYRYGSFDLLVCSFGNWEKEYDEAYDEIAAYVSKVNAELKGNRYFNAWCYAEMLTPKEQGQYNDIHCRLFHTWLVDKMLTCDAIIVSKTNVCGKDIREKIDVYDNLAMVAKIARQVSGEMLQHIHLPGEYIHSCYTKNSDLFLKNYPIFEMGYTLPYSIQLIDKEYCSRFKGEE